MVSGIKLDVAADKFAKRWEGKGDEKQDAQRFWIDYIQNVGGIEDPASFLRFEQRVKLSHTSFIDVMIPATRVLIEQKSRNKNLNEPIKQSDGTYLTPMEQGCRYANALPNSERPRWIVTCNFREFQVLDLEHPNDPPQVIELRNLSKEYYRLNFLVDVRDSRITKELEISKEAGEIIGRIYKALLPLYEQAPIEHNLALSYLNKLCVRLVFCFYAEDAGLFGRRNLFHDYMEGHSIQHLGSALHELFKVLDTPVDQRDIFLDKDQAVFPYVNGSLFKEDVPIPPINEEVRKLILDDGCNFDWSNMSPVIFGSLFESCLNPETRRQGGMHYTSVENIHKVIDPLFLDEYKHKFQQAMQLKTLTNRTKALKTLQKELASGKYFDPACGSGNFLTESYISLRRLENDILRETITDKAGTGVLGFAEEEYNPIMVSIQQFFGIEINDFAVSVAKTALWIAESQMFKETEEIIHKDMDFLPLTTNANIHEGNALRLDWQEILSPNDNVHIMGNPPFSGGRRMTEQNKSDLLAIAKDFPKNGNLDFVSGWYIKAAQYIQQTHIHVCFVSTNSISEGEQVILLWKKLFHDYHIVFDFAYTTFNWKSEAKSQAGVHCVIIGFSAYESYKQKQIIHDGGIIVPAKHINGYLIDAEDVWIESRTKPICDVPQISNGNKPLDHAICAFTTQERDDFIKKEPLSKPYFYRYMGSKEFINNIKRWFLLLNRIPPNLFRKMPYAKAKAEEIREYRLKSSSKITKALADTPTKFHYENMPNHPFLVIPQTSSGRRRYIPIGFLTPDIITNNKLQIMRDGGLYEFGILSSNVHNAWIRAVAGRLRNDFTYSISVVYNNFPWPTPTPAQKDTIEKTAQEILDARKLYPNSSLADLYDPAGMANAPALLKAHRDNNKAVMKAYGFWHRIPNTEPACVAALMKMYQELTINDTKS